MIPLLAAFTAGFTLGAGYAIWKVRNLRRQIVRTNSIVLQAQTRRAQQFTRFCEPCKQIINPARKSEHA